MAVDAFVIRYAATGVAFRSAWLASPDFNVEMLKTICSSSGLHTRGDRTNILDRIEREIGDTASVRRLIIQLLVQRPKEWLAVKVGKVKSFPEQADPTELVISEGHERWYGPVGLPSDPDARWYIRPVFVEHWEQVEGSYNPLNCCIRWLCFARVTGQTISLHWRNFTWTSAADLIGKGVQFDYWTRIPGIYAEIAGLTKASVKDPDWFRLILHRMWDRYRYNPDYEWVDQRIRAQAGGVAVSAHAGAMPLLDVSGLRSFAETIRKNIEYELRTTFQMKLPNPGYFDEVVLRTLFREYGARSYGFSLTQNGHKLLRLHTYFGVLEQADTPDALAHHKVFQEWGSDVQQLKVLLDQLEASDYADDQFEQTTLFSGLEGAPDSKPNHQDQFYAYD